MITESNFGGVLGALFIATIVLTLLLSPFLRTLYRRAVARAMRDQRAAENAVYPEPSPKKPNSSQLEFEPVVTSQQRALRPVLALRYLLATLAFAAAMTLVLFSLTGFEFLPRRTLAVFLIFATAPLAFVTQVLGLRWYWGIIALAAIFSVVVAITGFEPLLVYLAWILPATVVALLVANSYLRTSSIPILVMAALLSISLLFVLQLAIVLLQVGLFNSILSVFPSGLIQLLNISLSILITLCVGVLVAIFAIRFVAWLTVNSSELMMQADIVFGVQSIWMIIVGWSDLHVVGLAYLLAFAIYRLVLWSIPNGGDEEPGLLLLLRVFGNKRNQEALFRSRLLGWRQNGSVMLIGAEDLATETMDATEMSAFLSRRLDRLFINNPQDLEQSIRINNRRFADGLYPVRDYYCRDNSWKPTIRNLMGKATAVILDLRGFDDDNRGVKFEIGELAQRVPAKIIRILIDADTDVKLAKCLFRKEWEKSGSPAVEIDKIVLEDMR